MRPVGKFGWTKKWQSTGPFRYKLTPTGKYLVKTKYFGVEATSEEYSKMQFAEAHLSVTPVKHRETIKFSEGTIISMLHMYILTGYYKRLPKFCALTRADEVSRVHKNGDLERLEYTVTGPVLTAHRDGRWEFTGRHQCFGLRNHEDYVMGHIAIKGIPHYARIQTIEVSCFENSTTLQFLQTMEQTKTYQPIIK